MEHHDSQLALIPGEGPRDLMKHHDSQLALIPGEGPRDLMKNDSSQLALIPGEGPRDVKVAREGVSTGRETCLPRQEFVLWHENDLRPK